MKRGRGITIGYYEYVSAGTEKYFNICFCTMAYLLLAELIYNWLTRKTTLAGLKLLQVQCITLILEMRLSTH